MFYIYIYIENIYMHVYKKYCRCFFCLTSDCEFIMPRAGLRNSLVEPPRSIEEQTNICDLSLNEVSIKTKNRKRTRKVLHPIATDTDISSPSILTDSACASPARRARLLNPGIYFY